MKTRQKEKFVRNRDVKLKEKEIRQEEKIRHGMCEGVCPRCRDKMQWRFQFNKYKPLKKIAGCQQCRKKNITKAYRVLCDGCAKEKNVCPGCCADIIEQQLKRKERDEYLGINDEDEKDKDEDIDEMQTDDCDDAGEMTREAHNSDSISNKKSRSCNVDNGTESSSGASGEWDEAKFAKIAAAKYSKERIVGSSEDQTI